MEKKKFTSWGVGFASLALVAGMMSYLGITNKDKTSKSNTEAQAKVSSQSSTQVAQSSNNQNSTIPYKIPNQATNNNGSQQSTNQSSSVDQSSFSQHGNFDTTTGGS